MKSVEEKKAAIGAVIDGLANIAIDGETIRQVELISKLPEDLRRVIDDYEKALERDDEDMAWLLKYENPIINCVEELVTKRAFAKIADKINQDEEPDSRAARALEAAYLYIKKEFIEAHLEEAFEQTEGFGCSTDKARTVFRAAIKSKISGKPIDLDYKQQYTYHLPKIILKSDQEIHSFCRAVVRLYYGTPDHYVRHLGEFFEKKAEAMRLKRSEAIKDKASEK